PGPQLLPGPGGCGRARGRGHRRLGDAHRLPRPEGHDGCARTRRDRGMTRRALYTFLSAAIVVALFVSIDCVMGRLLGTVVWVEGIGRKVAKYALEIFVAGLALALTRGNAYRGLFLGLCFLLDLLWYGFVIYYHAPLEPQHVLLGVHELDDVWTEFVAQLPHFLPYLGLIALAYGVAAVALQRLQPRTFHLSIAPVLLFAVVLTEPALIYASNLDV